MKYLEFSFRTTPCTEVVNDVLSAVLADAGFESFVEQPDGLLAYIQQRLYDEASVEAAISEFPIPDTAIEYAYHGVTSARASDIIRLIASAEEIPDLSRSFRYRLSAVMPGIVLISLR